MQPAALTKCNSDQEYFNSLKSTKHKIYRMNCINRVNLVCKVKKFSIEPIQLKLLI